MTERFPGARTTEQNVKRGVLDESYLAVSPFDVDERRVRRQMKQRAATSRTDVVGRHAAKAGRPRAERRG